MEGSAVGADVAEQPASDAAYYCPQCGARYSGPGLCANGHPDAEVAPLNADAAAQDGTSDPAPQVPAPPATEPAPAPPAGVSADVAAEAASVIAGVRDGLAHLESLFGIGGA